MPESFVPWVDVHVCNQFVDKLSAILTTDNTSTEHKWAISNVINSLRVAIAIYENHRCFEHSKALLPIHRKLWKLLNTTADIL